MDYVLALLFPVNGKPCLRLNYRVEGRVIPDSDEPPVSGVQIATILTLHTAKAYMRRVGFLLLADEFAKLTIDSELDMFEVELHWLAKDLEGVEVTHQIPIRNFVPVELVSVEKVMS